MISMSVGSYTLAQDGNKALHKKAIAQPQEHSVAKEKTQLRNALNYTAFAQTLLPDLPSKVGDLECCVSVLYGGKATVGELIAVLAPSWTSSGRRQKKEMPTCGMGGCG